jgi:hypothetical protein
MERRELIKELLSELSYRSNEGYPILDNKEHISILAEILDEFGLGSIKNELIENLLEAEAKSKTDDLYKSIGGTGYVLAKDYDKWEKNKDAYTGDKFTKGKDGQYTKQDGDGTADDTPKTGTAVDVNSDYAKAERERVKRVNGNDNKESSKTKNKSLSNVNTQSSEVFTETETGISDEAFANGKAKPIYKDKKDELKASDLDEYFKSNKIPKKYQKVITRLINTQNGKQEITDYMTGVGAGVLPSQAGEILTMSSIGMSDEEFEGFMSTLEKQVAKYPKGTKPIITKEWLESVRHVRTVTNKRYDSQFGKGNWEISNVAWDVPAEFEALGNDNYNENKGFSSDMYVKVSSNGKPVLDEISLKKDSNANIYNGVVTDIKEWSSNVPDAADIAKYKKGEIERPTQYGKDAVTLQVDRKILTSELVMKNKELRTTLNALGVVSGNAKDGYKVEPKAEEIISKLESMPIPPPIDLDRFKETFGTGDKTRFKKYLIMHAAVQRAKEISEGNTEKTTASEFLNNHIGYEKGDDGKFPEGSIKRYQNDTIQFLVEDEEAKEGCLNALAEKLPMKALLGGEEKMAIGGLSADPKTLSRVFGISSYDDFKAGLTMKEDEDGNNFLVYESKGPPAKSVPISIVKVRQKGQGYASSVGLEFEIAPEFARALYDANKEEYPPEPEISKKERRRLKVDSK